MPNNPSPASRSLTTTRFLSVLLGLTFVAVAACKSSKQETTASPAPATQASAAAQAPATTAHDESPEADESAPAKEMKTQGHQDANASETKAGAKAIEARKPPQPGLVWVNLKNGTYHTETSPHYGKTAKGQWMKESKAIARGYKPVGTGKAAATSDAAAAGSDAEHKPATH